MAELTRLEGGDVQKAAYSMSMHDFTAGDFDLHVGKSGRIWLVQATAPVDGWIYVSDTDPDSRGFAGGSMTWNVPSQNCKITLRGPWHASPSDLYEDTGVDVRDQNLSQGVVSRGITHGNAGICSALYSDVLHFDDTPVVGLSCRVKSIAQELANKHQEKLKWWSAHSRGGMGGTVEPES